MSALPSRLPSIGSLGPFIALLIAVVPVVSCTLLAVNVTAAPARTVPMMIQSAPGR